MIVTLLITTPRTAERYGDNLQIVIPVLAGMCSIANGNFGDFATRFIALEAAIHIPKNTLGEIELNLRPSGNTGGFPSGHTAATTFGATNLIYNCFQANPVVKTSLILSAAFVGASRIEAEKHNIWQVLAGWILGFMMDRMWRRGKGPYPFVKTQGKRVSNWIKKLPSSIKQTYILWAKPRHTEQKLTNSEQDNN